jgi:hypothetical protein
MRPEPERESHGSQPWEEVNTNADEHRYVLTETDELAAALELAAKRWPQDAGSGSKLLLRLVRAGEQALGQERAQARARRREAVRHTHGQFRGLYEPGYLERLRDEWPA